MVSKQKPSAGRTDTMLGVMPVVEPVVITIGNDSSDDSDTEQSSKHNRKVSLGLDGQLDLFLAAQRQTVEVCFGFNSVTTCKLWVGCIQTI